MLRILAVPKQLYRLQLDDGSHFSRIKIVPDFQHFSLILKFYEPKKNMHVHITSCYRIKQHLKLFSFAEFTFKLAKINTEF